MYSAVSNVLHYLSRTGSHSTKGSPRGFLWNPPPVPKYGMNDQQQALYSAAVNSYRYLCREHEKAVRTGVTREYRMNIEAQIHALKRGITKSWKMAQGDLKDQLI